MRGGGGRPDPGAWGRRPRGLGSTHVEFARFLPPVLPSQVNICEYLIRPVERAVASWPEGDGAGMSTGSCWPVVSVSAQVVGVSSRGGRGSLGSGRSAGCAFGEDRTSPRLGAMAGIRGDHVPGGLHALAWLPVPSTTRRNLPAGFAPARTAINVPPQAPIEVRAYLVSARRRVRPSSTDLVFRDDARLQRCAAWGQSRIVTSHSKISRLTSG